MNVRGDELLHGGARAVAGSGPPLRAVPLHGSWRIRGGRVLLDQPVVMGIVNLTPDSFSDGGRLRSVAQAMDHAHALVAQGAGLIDVGGESTRPGAQEVPVQEELDRILPFLHAAAGNLGVPVTVDTRKAAVAQAGLEAGAAAINDVSGFRFDPSMAGVVARAGAGAVLMHMRGAPDTMSELADYTDVGTEVAAELRGTLALAAAAGIPRDALVVDPGLGFAKTPAQTLALLGDLGPVLELGLPVLVGPSRKRFIGDVLGVAPQERVAGTVAACVLAYLGGARIFRVHDVAPVAQALAVVQAVQRAQRKDTSR